MNKGALALAREAFQSYVAKDRQGIEAILDENFQFTSPLDNALSRETYLKRCWPNSNTMESCTEIHGVEFGDKAVIVYEIQTSTGKRFRNTEIHTARDGKLLAVEVYFGWDLPHKAPPGGFIKTDAPTD